MPKPYVIEANTTNDAFILIARALLTDGKRRSPRGLLTLELNDAWIHIENPGLGVCTLGSRDINTSYLTNELNWYKSGSLNVADIEKHSSFWTKLADTNGTVNSNYGFLAMTEKHSGKSQLEWCIAALLKDKDTRQAVINYNQPRHKYEGNKDFVCTLTQLFRHENDKLDTVVSMRSNDVIFGLTYDLPWFTFLVREVSAATGIKPGAYAHYAASLHVYERHFKMLEAIAEEKLC